MVGSVDSNARNAVEPSICQRSLSNEDVEKLRFWMVLLMACSLLVSVECLFHYFFGFLFYVAVLVFYVV